MKKIALSLLVLSLLLITGCTAVDKGDYKEGTYFGTAKTVAKRDEMTYLSTAVVYVNEDGMIKSLFVDCTYDKDNALSTKKALGTEYGMKGTSASIGVIPGGAEWDEQVINFENKVIEEQGLDWLEWKDETNTKTDSVSGVTISVNTIYEAVNNALAQAK